MKHAAGGIFGRGARAASLSLVLALLVASPASAAFDSEATDWSNFFGADGYVTVYTNLGQPICDYETSSDSTVGGAAASPDRVDLASGSPGSAPGPYETPSYGYYNGGTVWDPADPSTMLDDFILFRMRLRGNPKQGAAFDSYHWNVLVDVDNDGYKEYWVDLNGSYRSSQSGPDQLQILYNDDNTQEIANPDVARVEEFAAYYSPDANGYSHTEVLACSDGTGDYFVDIQVPMTAFKDTFGNQVLYPDSPVGFVFSTGASNQDPLQKDWMMDLNFMGLNNPINFGDVVRADGEPDLYFADSRLGRTSFYTVGDDVYMYLHYPRANSDSGLQTVTVTVTSPLTGDDELVTLVESGPDTGIFTNRGGASQPQSTDPAEAWLPFANTSAAAVTERWTATYSAATGLWTVSGTVSGTQTATAEAGVPYTSDGGQVSFTIFEDDPANGTTVTFDTVGADPLASIPLGAPVEDNNGALSVVSGETIYFSYTTPGSLTYTSSAAVVGQGEPFISFTRADGRPCSDFILAADPEVSDKIYVTVYHSQSNTDHLTAETIQVTLSGNDGETLTLVETGPDTGIFRNVQGLETQIEDATPPVQGDSLWEDIDDGSVTATFVYDGVSYDTQASLFRIEEAGRVYFVNGAGTETISQYTFSQPVFIRVEDETYTCGGTMTVTVTSDSGDSETIALTELSAGANVYMNRTGDLVTTDGSPAVTSASSTFVTDGLQAGDPFVIAAGPDVGTYEVLSVDSETQVTLTAALTATRTSVAFNAFPLMAATFDGTPNPGDGILEAADGDAVTVTYHDCSDGDLDPVNDDKTSVAAYNAPSLVINEVLFYPDSTYGQTEYFQVFNNTASALDITGYTVTDGDAFTYAFPQVGGADVVLQPGQKAYVALYARDGVSSLNYYDAATDAWYLFVNAGGHPSQQFEDPGSAVPADQLLLRDAGGEVIDYVGWSATLPTEEFLDFQGDDSPAVSAGIWTDDAYRNVWNIQPGFALMRSSDGYDTNEPSDWVYANTSALWAVTGPIVTQAAVTAFEAVDDAGRVVLHWRTASESGTAGFRVWRLGAGGARNQVGRGLLPGVLQPPLGGDYFLADPEAAAGVEYEYLLEELEAGGRSLAWGPFRVSARRPEATPLEPVRGYLAQPRGPNSARVSALARRGAQATGAEAVKFGVRTTGLHRIGAGDIAGWLGLQVDQARALIASGGLELTSRGRRVAYLPAADGNGLYFFGRAWKGRYARERTFVLRRGAGLLMRTAAAQPGADPGGSFTESLRLEESRYALPGFFEDPAADWWYWEWLLAGDPADGARSFDFEAPGFAPGTGAWLTVRLRGLTDTEAPMDHHALVSLNGSALGNCWWDGGAVEERTFPFDPSLLREGANRLEVAALLDTGAAYSIFYVDGFELSYPRLYRASGDSLLWRSEDGRAVTLEGFTGPGIILLDVTSPRRPKLVTGARIAGGEGSWRLSFTPASGAAYLAAAAGSAVRVEEAEELRGARLRDRSNAADYLVVTSPELRQAVRPLASWRESQGLRVAVADVGEIMDAFNHGAYSPLALKRFLAFALRKWAAAPRYVLLAGNGTWDYRDLKGMGDNLVPTLMAPTGRGLAASDTLLGDVLGNDLVPEMAVGRLPARSAEQMRAMAAKIIAREGGLAGDGPGAALLVADNPDAGGDFDAQTEALGALLPENAGEPILLSALGLDGARARISSGVASGAAFLNYFGHGGLDRFAHEGLLTADDVRSLRSEAGPPTVTAMTCVTGGFAIPGLDSLGELMVLEPQAGAVAFWGPSGFSNGSAAAELDGEFYRAVYAGGARTLGDAVLAAMRGYAGRGGPSFMLSIFNLLGDPAMRLRAPLERR